MNAKNCDKMICMFNFTGINYKQQSRMSNSVWGTHEWVVGALLVDSTEGDQLFVYTARDGNKSVSTCKQESHNLITKYVQTGKSQSDHKVRANRKVTI